MSDISPEELVARNEAFVQMLNTRFSALEDRMDRLHASVLKWVIGSGLAFSIGSLIFMMFVVQDAQKSAEQPSNSYCACKLAG